MLLNYNNEDNKDAIHWKLSLEIHTGIRGTQGEKVERFNNVLEDFRCFTGHRSTNWFWNSHLTTYKYFKLNLGNADSHDLKFNNGWKHLNNFGPSHNIGYSVK